MCETVCECVGGQGWGRVDLELGGYPEWRGEGVEAGGWEACVILFLSLSPAFSVSLICGFQLLTCLGGGACVCVYLQTQSNFLWRRSEG